MRLLILFISFLVSQVADSQIINASPPYRVRAGASCAGFVIDSLSSATVQTAYSFRKLKCSYTGNCLRVRRSSDNTESDIGFISNFLDTASLKTFVGTGGTDDGFIVSLYDQSGNSRTMTQATTTNQPRIMDNGVISYDSDNSKLAPLGQTSWATSSFTAYPDSLTSNFVMRPTYEQAYNASQTKTSGNIPAPLDHYNQAVFEGNGSSYTNLNMSTTFNVAGGGGAWVIKLTSASTTAKMKAWKDNSNVLDGSTSYYGDTNNQLIIGSRGDAATSFYGHFFEAITFSAVSESDLSKLMLNQMAYYGY